MGDLGINSVSTWDGLQNKHHDARRMLACKLPLGMHNRSWSLSPRKAILRCYSIGKARYMKVPLQVPCDIFHLPVRLVTVGKTLREVGTCRTLERQRNPLHLNCWSHIRWSHIIFCSSWSQFRSLFSAVGKEIKVGASSRRWDSASATILFPRAMMDLFIEISQKLNPAGLTLGQSRFRFQIHDTNNDHGYPSPAGKACRGDDSMSSERESPPESPFHCIIAALLRSQTSACVCNWVPLHHNHQPEAARCRGPDYLHLKLRGRSCSYLPKPRTHVSSS